LRGPPYRRKKVTAPQIPKKIKDSATQEDLNLNSSRSLNKFPRGKSQGKTEAKTTVSVYLPRNIVEKQENTA